jgi:hypothetical protein
VGEHAALAHARRLLLADEIDVDRRGDDAVEPDLLQVDVRDDVPDLVALVVLQDRRMGRAAVAANDDVEDRVRRR